MINDKLAYKIWKLREGSPKYCFPLNRFLEDEHGLIKEHVLVGVKVKDIEDGDEFVIETVYAQWYLGWYYKALMVNKQGSHAQLSWNINSESDINNYARYRLIDFEYDFSKDEIK